MIRNTLFVLIILLGLSSCDKPKCVNSIDTDQVQLAENLKSHNNIQYTFKELRKRDGRNILVVDAEGANLCAEIEMTLVEQAKGFEDLLENNGRGYHGAQLVDLNFMLLQEKERTEFVVMSVGDIVD